MAALQHDSTRLNPFEIEDPGNLPPPSVKDLVEKVFSTQTGLVDLVPATLDLMYVALGRTPPRMDVIERRFKRFVDDARERYQLIVIDCHPAGSLLTRAALLNTDHVLIPVRPDAFAARGALLMRDFLRALRKDEKVPFHVLFNGMRPSDGVSEPERQIRQNDRLKAACLTHRLRWWTALQRLHEGRDSIWESTKPYSYKAWNNLVGVADELATRIGLWGDR